MFELINTSVPEGLLSGAHGFATVAMTRGMSENLRNRLETFCAYQHRSNAHDATFYRTNPVNWFHVCLAQGEHVLGRVAPCEFDYTGRTNRLAHVCVFEAGEWPRGKSAAAVLEQKVSWFTSPWLGEAHYLEKDDAKAAELQGIKAVEGLRNWTATFGSQGAELAQRVAWQIEHNLLTGGPSIFFKTSTEWDVTGEKLVGLFSEVIELLSEEVRARVTFATYPDAMPNEVECLLRGTFAADSSFVRALSSQAWIDCVGGRVVHPEYLPSSRANWSTLLETARRENVELRGALHTLQEANARLDQECARWKGAYEKAEEENTRLKKEHEKLKCSILVNAGKLGGAAVSPVAGGAAPSAAKVPRPVLGDIQLERAHSAKRGLLSSMDASFWWVVGIGVVIIVLIVVGMSLMKHSEELALGDVSPIERHEGGHQ